MGTDITPTFINRSGVKVLDYFRPPELKDIDGGWVIFATGRHQGRQPPDFLGRVYPRLQGREVARAFN